MSTYLSKEELLGSKLVTADVEAFGGTVLVSEMPADLVQRWLDSGVMSSDGKMDMSKVDMIEAAARVIRNPETLEPLLTRNDAKKLADKSYGGVQKCVLKAMEITDFGGADDDEKN